MDTDAFASRAGESVGIREIRGRYLNVNCHVIGHVIGRVIGRIINESLTVN